MALAPVNGTTERLNLSTPKDRQRWGFEGERAGLREWAGENGLGVVGELTFSFFLSGFEGVIVCAGDVDADDDVCRCEFCVCAA